MREKEQDPTGSAKGAGVASGWMRSPLNRAHNLACGEYSAQELWLSRTRGVIIYAYVSIKYLRAALYTVCGRDKNSN